jgi:tetratricopeptide (TPR) repeat protein
MIPRLLYSIMLFVSIVCVAPLKAQSAKKLVKEAKSLYELQDFTGAQEKLQAALALESENDDALFLRGKTYKAQKDCRKAIADFQMAASFQPKNDELFEALAQCQLEVGAVSDALISIDRMLALSPKTSRYYHFKEDVLFSKKDFEKLAATTDQAISMDKSDDYSYFMKGRAADGLSNVSLAETQFIKAIELALDDKSKRDNASVLHPYYQELANVQKKLFKNQNAVLNYSKAIEMNPSDVNSLVNRGIVYFEMKDLPAASADFTKAISMNAKNPEAFYWRAQVNQQMGQFASAISDYNQAINIDEKRPNYFVGRAECYFTTSDFSSAVRDYKKALELNPSDAALNKAYANARQKKYDTNRETVNPSIKFVEPKIINGVLQIREDADHFMLKALITDASPIKSIVVDGKSIPLAEDEMNPEINQKIDLKDKKEFSIQVADVYLNGDNQIIKIEKTEVGKPVVNISNPYQTVDNELFIPNNPSILIEGKVHDQSLIKSIIINGTSASFPLEMTNPSFQALVVVGTQDTLAVQVTDILGNESITNYTLIREDTSGANPMGSTWVVFIENSNYKNLQKLEGPARDVADMTVALSKYKIDKIITKKDASKADLDKFFSIDLRDQIQKNRVKSLIIWYAGHGKFLNETGYWIPVDGDNYDEYTYYSINNLRASMQAYTMLKHVLVISDACESGPAFYMAMRDEIEPRVCDDWEVAKFRSAQVITSSNKEFSTDNSLFTQAFANTLNNNPNDCISVESIALKVMGVVKQNQRQSPKFGKIKGLDDENGTFFFIKKKF